MEHNRIYHFGQFFALLPPNDPENQNFEKMKKMPADIIILHMSTINGFETWCMTDGQRDRWMEKVTYRGECPT